MFCWHLKSMMTQYLKKQSRIFKSFIEKNVYSTMSFRVRILLPKSHTCALQYIGLSSHVAVPVCGHFGLWLFWFVAVLVGGRFGLWPFGLWPFRPDRFGLWPFRFVNISVCGRFGCAHFGLWLLWPVTVKVIYLYTLGSISPSFLIL